VDVQPQSNLGHHAPAVLICIAPVRPLAALPWTDMPGKIKNTAAIAYDLSDSRYVTLRTSGLFRGDMRKHDHEYQLWKHL